MVTIGIRRRSSYIVTWSICGVHIFLIENTKKEGSCKHQTGSSESSKNSRSKESEAAEAEEAEEAEAVEGST